jgi:hypothetical protein
VQYGATIDLAGMREGTPDAQFAMERSLAMGNTGARKIDTTVKSMLASTLKRKKRKPIPMVPISRWHELAIHMPQVRT